MLLRPRDLARAVQMAMAALAASAIPGGCALIAGLSDDQPYPVVQITAGAEHACLLLNTGEVWCWGDNTYGQLGHRTVDGGECTTACPAAPVAGVSGAVQISAGGDFTCAVVTGGAVQCWGGNGMNQLGRTVTTMCNGTPCDDTPAPASGVAGAVQIAAGGVYACARTAAGAVTCWGDNTYGQLGAGNVMPATGAVTVKGIGPAVDLSTSLVGSITCAAGKTAVWCWGRNDYGGTGHMPNTAGDVMAMGKPVTQMPAAVPGLTGAAEVRAGDYGACSGTASGTFDCWGYNGIGTLGTKDTTNDVVPSPVIALQGVAGIGSLDLRADHTCVIDDNGQAWCWGVSGLGALGTENGTLGDTCDQNIRCQRKAQKVGPGNVTQIAVGTSFSVALLANGTVVAWGMNDKGQLGHHPGSGGDGPCPANGGNPCDGTPSHVAGPPPP
jgi:alpha-tubulin suppressor-like RCC1 family protein